MVTCGDVFWLPGWIQSPQFTAVIDTAPQDISPAAGKRVIMRVRTFALAAAACAGLGLAGSAWAGTASAATPFVIPQIGAAGVELDHGETQALAESPIPALVDRYAPHDAVIVGLQPDSTLLENGHAVFADMPAIVGEAAAHPGGSVDVVLSPKGLGVFQVW